ncbi:MAG: 3-methyladenine DNA glycosylase [Verrucomicrobiales bacterium]
MIFSPDPDADCLRILPADVWRSKVHECRTLASRWTEPARRRKATGNAHPIDDFLFTYYPFSMRKLGQWHPGTGVALEVASDLPDWLQGRFYRHHDGLVSVNLVVPEKKWAALKWTRSLLIATRDRAPNFACHGLHEWAMVHTGQEIRHRESCPLRLTQSEIDQVVENRPLCCTHFDAFRFFPRSTQPKNRFQLSMESRIDHEQPGCVHVGMDLYKWASKCMPWVSADLRLECFELAIELRRLDMRASPYDLSAYGLLPIKVETPDGRKAYEQEQREFARRAAPLRQRLIEELSCAIALIETTHGAPLSPREEESSAASAEQSHSQIRETP